MHFGESRIGSSLLPVPDVINGVSVCAPHVIAKIELLPPQLCPKCSQPAPNGQVCDLCRNDPPPWQACRSWASYRGPMRSAIHRLKYKNDIGLCEPLGKHLVQLLQEQAWPVDCIVPVPLNSHRRRERGYNQSALLAFTLALQTGLPSIPSALLRTRNTRSQVGLTAEERHSNLDGAFSARADRISGRKVLLLDDVMTTGATLRNAARGTSYLRSNPGICTHPGKSPVGRAHQRNSGVIGSPREPRYRCSTFCIGGTVWHSKLTSRQRIWKSPIE